jgi:hypothetical protein
MTRALLRTPVPLASLHWRTLLLATLVLCLSTGTVRAAGDGKPATKLVNVADTRDAGPGLAKWVGDAYNGNRYVYGLIVVVVMAVQGAALGFAFDKLIGLLGIRLGKLDHHE